MALATDVIEGEIQLTGDLAGDGGAQIGSNPQLTHIGGLTPGQYINPKVTVDAKGRVTAIATATPSEVSAVLTPATTSEAGTVQIGDNLYITGSPTAGTATINCGGLTTGTSTGFDNCGLFEAVIQVNGASSYTISDTGTNLPTIQEVLDLINNGVTGATAAVSGGNIVITSSTTGRGSTIDIVSGNLFTCLAGYLYTTTTDGVQSCEIYVPVATDSVAGVVSIGTGIDVIAGEISVDLGTLPIATNSTLGTVIVPTAGNIDIDGSGNISIPPADKNTIGLIQLGDGLIIGDLAGEVDVDTASLNYPKSAEGTEGVMQPGIGLSVTTPGTVDVDVDEILATTTTAGTVIVPTAGNIDIDGSGNISIPVASAGAVGLVQVGSGLQVDVNGVISIDTGSYPDATTSSKGVMQIGLHLNDTGGAGIIGVDKASGNTTYGVVRSANTSNLTITTGEIDVGSNVAKLNVSQVFTASQSVSSSSLTSGATISVDASLSNVFTLTLGTNATLSNPTNIQAGQTILFVFEQDATGGRTLSYGSNYKFRQGITPTLTSTANSIDVMTCVSDGTNLYCSFNGGFA